VFWKKRFLELMMQQTAAIERLCTMQHVVIQHMQHLLMLHDVMPERLIVPDAFTHPLFRAFEELDITTIPHCPAGEKAGYVYVLVTENGWSKIGMSRDIKVRIKQVKIQLAYRSKLVHVIPTDDVVWAEGLLKKVFEDCRVFPKVQLIHTRGKSGLESTRDPIPELGTEIFRLSAQAVIWIKSIQHMNFPGKDEADWNETVISSPGKAMPDAGAYRAAHYGYLNNGKRRRIELLEEYDVDKFWCQFVEPTQKPAKMEKKEKQQTDTGPTGLRDILKNVTPKDAPSQEGGDTIKL
jgi:hypothetical protein